MPLGPDPDSGLEELAGPRSQDARYCGFGWISVALASLQADEKLAPTLANCGEAKRALVVMLSQHGPRLTEDAWDSIVDEVDLEVVTWWLALACLNVSGQGAYAVKRAFFENAALGEHARRLGGDEKEMRSVRESVEKLRSEQSQPRKL